MSKPYHLVGILVAGLLLQADCNAQSTAPAIFITNNVGDSITSMNVNSDGSLSYVGTYASGEGPQAISLSPDGRFLAVGHGTISSVSEQLRIFQVNSDSSLTHVFTNLVPDSPLDVLWLDNQHLAVTETSLSNPNNVRTFAFDRSANTFTPVDVDGSGSFNTALERSNNGEFLFANSSLGTSAIYSFSVTGGMLHQADVEFMGSNFAVDIKASHDGRFLYGAGGISGDDHRVFGFTVDEAGLVDPLPAVSFASPGTAPKVIGLTADDTILVAGHGGDGSIRTFLRDTTTGELTSTSFQIPGSQGSLGDLQVMGNLLFMTDENSATASSYRIGSNGSLTQLGTAIPSQGSRPEYIAAWQGLDSLVCDFDSDSDCDLADLNQLLVQGPISEGVAVTPGSNGQFDLNLDGVIDLLDRDFWLSSAATENGLGSPYKLGDANLDGTVDGQDFLAWNGSKFSERLRWNLGDFNGDGNVNGTDFLAWNANKFTSAGVTAVPEPLTSRGVALVTGALWGWSRRRRRWA